MRVNVISQAAGSAYVENGDTKIICGVYGPKQAKKGFSDRGRLWCDFKYASFAEESRPEKRGQSDEEREISLTLTEAVSVSVILEKFPKAVIEAYVLVLEAGASSDVLATGITCLSLAIANAGVDCYGLVAACSSCLLDGTPLLDPSTSESTIPDPQGANLLVAYMASLNQITHVSQRGTLPLEQLEQLTDLALDGCSKMHECMKVCLLESAS
jgi:exosome complex component MTR3